MKISITRQDIEKHPEFIHQQKISRRKLNPTDWLKSFKQFAWLYDDLVKNFDHVKVVVTSRVDDYLMEFQYWKGRGKTFQEGRSRLPLDIIGHDLLIPELEKISEQYNNAIIHFIPRQLAA